MKLTFEPPPATALIASSPGSPGTIREPRREEVVIVSIVHGAQDRRRGVVTRKHWQKRWPGERIEAQRVHIESFSHHRAAGALGLWRILALRHSCQTQALTDALSLGKVHRIIARCAAAKAPDGKTWVERKSLPHIGSRFIDSPD